MKKNRSKKSSLGKVFVLVCFIVVGERTYYLMQESHEFDYYLVPPMYIDSVKDYSKFRLPSFLASYLIKSNI